MRTQLDEGFWKLSLASQDAVGEELREIELYKIADKELSECTEKIKEFLKGKLSPTDWEEYRRMDFEEEAFSNDQYGMEATAYYHQGMKDVQQLQKIIQGQLLSFYPFHPEQKQGL